MEKKPSCDVPEKCRECAKSSRPFIHGRCGFCQSLGFEEEVFCYLNQSSQNASSFECHAFQPVLKLAGKHARETRPDPGIQSAEISLERILNSDRVKYQRALALQKLARDPNDVILDIKYHFAWNVAGRRQAFIRPDFMIEFINNIFTSCSKAVGGFAAVLWLAPDHIHIYVESDGTVSPDKMAKKLKQVSEKPILEKLHDIMASSEATTGLWDESYFVGTIG